MTGGVYHTLPPYCAVVLYRARYNLACNMRIFVLHPDLVLNCGQSIHDRGKNKMSPTSIPPAPLQFS